MHMKLATSVLFVDPFISMHAEMDVYIAKFLIYRESFILKVPRST